MKEIPNFKETKAMATFCIYSTGWGYRNSTGGGVEMKGLKRKRKTVKRQNGQNGKMAKRSKTENGQTANGKNGKRQNGQF